MVEERQIHPEPVTIKQREIAMAELDKPQLRIDADVTGPNPSATLTVTYTAHWDTYDQNSRQQYREFWKVVGADQGVGEDGVDDFIRQTPAHEFIFVASDGSASSVHEIVIEMELPALDEDPGANIDEIKVEVSLTPETPDRVEELSNRVLISA
ncbi:MAG TPA: hypothetical protein VIT65_22655 [Microlunatus sp.]